jgi:hypothetical protein
MKALNTIGGAFLLLVLGIASILGFQSTTGRPIWDGLWTATASVVSYFRGQAGGFDSVAGDGRAAIGWVATGFVLLLILLKKPISMQLFTILLLVGVAVAFVLWDPTVLR